MKNFGPAQCSTELDQTFKSKYLSEFETEFENILGC
jgi:hypothetical protein